MIPETFDTLNVDSFPTITLSFIVFFLGAFLTRQVAFLRNYNIPEPVTGGIAAACVTWAYLLLFDTKIIFDIALRDELLVIFFATIGLNARIADLLKGGKLLAILLVLTVSFIAVQNGIGLLVARMFDMPDQTSVLIGSASLIGGHGTSIAWGPTIEQASGFSAAPELGIAMATLGLIVAAMLGGPIAKFLIDRKNLQPADDAPDHDEVVVGVPYNDEEDIERQVHSKDYKSEEDHDEDDMINHVNFMRSFLAAHVAVFLGYYLNEQIVQLGLKLPLFVTCMLIGIVMSNTIPYLFPKLPWPARSRSMALISDYSLSIFLVMSLMSMQLWSITGFGSAIFIVLILQSIATTLFILLLFFRMMGSDYNAAVLSAGFAGFAMGATPTAIANMSSVTKRYGAAPLAFIILPLVSAFFVDIANALVIQFFVGL